MNGGALYFSNIYDDEGKIEDINESIFIENNIFEKNNAHYNGWAIDLEFYKLNIKKFSNNNITNNDADVFGSDIYLFNYISNEKMLFNILNIFENNVTESNIIDNYSSRLSSISLKNINKNSLIEAKPGDYIPLHFAFKDIFNSDVMDLSNYYSVITLKLLFFNKYNDTETKYKILGNICNFINGNEKYNKI